MRCAGSLQSLKVHRGFLGGMPPRMGNERLRVELGEIFREVSEGSVDKEEDVIRWRPAWVRRSEGAGRDVRRERSCRRVVIVVEGGRDRGIAGKKSCELTCIPNAEGLWEGQIISPESSLTNIFRFSWVSVELTEASEEDLDGRMMVDMWQVAWNRSWFYRR